MSSSARIPRQALLAVRRRSALCRIHWRALLVSVGTLGLWTAFPCIQLLYAYIWLLAVEATVERYARVPPRVLCQQLGMCTITLGAPYA